MSDRQISCRLLCSNHLSNNIAVGCTVDMKSVHWILWTAWKILHCNIDNICSNRTVCAQNMVNKRHKNCFDNILTSVGYSLCAYKHNANEVWEISDVSNKHFHSKQNNQTFYNIIFFYLLRIAYTMSTSSIDMVM